MSLQKEMYAEAKKYMVGGGSAGGRFNATLGQPLYMERCEGAYLYDVEGKRYIDFHSSAGPALFGYKHPRIEKAVLAAIEKGFYWGYDSQETIDLAKELCKLYTLMGDVVGYDEYYNRMKEHMTPQAKERAAEMVEYGEGKLPGNFTLEAVSLADDIRMLYRKDPQMAIDSLHSLVIESMRVSDKADPVIRDFNQLINWVIDTDGIVQAYPIICRAVDYANSTLRIVENELNLADLSEICYRANDIGNAKRFYVTYRNCVRKHFSKTDMEYLKSQYMGFKYLEA